MLLFFEKQFHISRIGLKPCTFTHMAQSKSPVTRHYHSVLYLILLAFDEIEILIDTAEILVAIPEHIYLFVCEFAVGSVYGETAFLGV